jgi:hypothetical protein
VLPRDAHTRVLEDLHYDKRRQDNHGRCLGSISPISAC